MMTLLSYLVYCGYSLETPDEVVLTSTHNLSFEQKYEKISDFFIWKFSFFGGEILNISEKVWFPNDKAYYGTRRKSKQTMPCSTYARNQLNEK